MRHQVPDRVVTIGGGTGSFTMLSELKKVVRNLWAIVAMTDSGGSSRRLMDEFGRPLPLGDLRQALVALSRSRKLWGDVFGYRFPDAPGGVVGGHSLGNLILHALEGPKRGRPARGAGGRRGDAQCRRARRPGDPRAGSA